MVLKNEYIVAGIIIALLIGSGAGYIYGQSPIAGYQEDVDRLEAENLGIGEKKAQLLEENTALQDQLDVLTENITITRSLLEEIQGKLEETKKDYGSLGQKYADLINLLNITEVKGYTQTINYTIHSGNEETWLFYLPYGAIWEAKICLSYDYCDMSHAWRQGELRTFAGSSGRGLSQYGLKGIPFLTGTITCEYYDDGGSTIYVTCTILSQYPELVRTAGDWISKTSVSVQISKLEYVSNGGFETDRTDGEWGFKDWETLGRVSSSSGYIGKGVFSIQNRYGGDAAQKIYFNNFPMKLSFWMKPQPTGEYVRLQVQIDRTTILYDKNFTGPNNNYQWTEVVLQFTPTEGIHEIRFYVLPGPDYYPKDSSSVGIDEVSITILSSPTIDGVALPGEWPAFQELNLEYWMTFNSEPWDTEDKTVLVSTLNYISHLYLCLKIPDDYVSEDFKIDSVQIYLDDGSGMVDSRFMLWDMGREYRQNSWIADHYKGEHDCIMGGTTDGMGQYSHTSGGSLGEEGIYTVELDLPLRAATDDIYDADAKPGETIYIEIHFCEVKEWTEEGTFYGSSCWKSKPFSITFTNP